MWASVCLPALASNKIRGKQVHRDQPFISLGILGEGIIRAGSRPGWSELAARPRSWTQAAPSKQPWPQAPPPPIHTSRLLCEPWVSLTVSGSGLRL